MQHLRCTYYDKIINVAVTMTESEENIMSDRYTLPENLLNDLENMVQNPPTKDIESLKVIFSTSKLDNFEEYIHCVECSKQ